VANLRHEGQQRIDSDGATQEQIMEVCGRMPGWSASGTKARSERIAGDHINADVDDRGDEAKSGGKVFLTFPF
jgi:hypothetical protein